MKKILISIFAFSFSVSLADEIKNINSELKSVTVFLNGAQENRTLKSNISVGNSTILVKGLTSTIEPNSIQVSGKGDVVIKSITHKLSNLNQQAKPKELITLEDSLERMNISIEKLQAKKYGLNEEHNFIVANRLIGGQQNGVKGVELEDISEFVRERLTAIKTDLIDLNYKEKKMQEQKNKVQTQITEQYTKRNITTSEIYIELQAKTATTADIELSFFVNNAGWAPIYDVRAFDSKKTVQLMMKANIFQNTGFDWKNAKLTLSTGNPTLGGVKPELSPWFLNIYAPIVYRKQQPSKTRAMGAAEMSAPMSQADNSMYAEMKEMESVSNYIQAVESNLRIDYNVEIPYTIPTDGKVHTVDVQKLDISTTFVHYAVPKLDPDAFLVAQLTDWDNFNLLPGNATVYYDGTLVGESYIDPMTANDTLNISLGRDKRVVVTRTQVKDKASKKLIGTNRTETKAFEINIRNTRKDAIEIILEDQIPISKTSEIEVELSDKGGANYNLETGKLVWNYKIDPADTKKTRFSFTVKYPKDKKVAGL